MLAYIHTTNGISILLDGVLTTISKDDSRYLPLTTALADGERNESVLAQLVAAPKEQLQRAIATQALSELISIGDNQVFYKGREVDNTLTRRMLEHLSLGIDITPLVPFLENLEQSPSRRVEQDLYGFLEYGKIPLTGDGHFLAYKAVRSDWMDIHSGSFDNSIGKVVEVERNQVDENPDHTCSHGLHVCSFDYLPHFSHADGHVVIVKVNPKDVVAIPRDYDNTKMRVCRYEVVAEVDGYYSERNNYLAQQPLFTDWDEEDEDEDEEDEYGGYSGDLPVLVTVFLVGGGVFATRRFDYWAAGLEYAQAALDQITPVVLVEDENRSVRLEYEHTGT